jgi:ATP-binding cassette subfamily B protein
MNEAPTVPGLQELKRRLGGLARLVRLGGEFRPYLRPYVKRVLLVAPLSLVYSLLKLLEPWPIQVVFDQAILKRKGRFLGIDLLGLVGGDPMLLLLLAAGALLLIAALSGTVYYIQTMMITKVGQSLVRSLREDVFHHMTRLSLSFHQRNPTGDLLMRLTGDMVMLRDMLMALLVTLTTELLMMIAVLALMIRVNWQLTLVAAMLGPVIYGLFRWFRSRMVEAARKQRKREGKVAAATGDVLLAIPMVQAFAAEAREDERFRGLAKRSQRASMRSARLSAGMQRAVEILVALSTSLVLFFGVRQILAGNLTPGVFLVFLSYLRSLYKPIKKMGRVTERTSRASAAASRILEVLHAPREVRDRRNAVEAPRFRGEIACTDLGFTYEDGTEALRDVNFEIRAGERVAVVGPTGAGKSTLFSLLLRFYRATAGQISIDGRNIKEFKVKSVRRQIAYLPQEPFIVGATVRENLLYGDPDADDERIRQALAAAGLAEFVDGLERGLDTEISPRGQSLSGGQKQRLAIARALLKDAPILLLDEPSSALDPRTERDVLKNLERLSRGRTTLTIAHSMSSLRSADRVLVLDQGRLIENGPPEELLARDSLFRIFAEIEQSGSSVRRPPEAPDRDEDLPLLPDPALKGVERLLRPRGREKFLREVSVLAPVDRRSRLTLLKQRVGQRAVLRIDPPPSPKAPQRRVFVKLVRGSGGVRRLEMQRMAHDAAMRLGFDVPRPIGFLRRYRAVLLEEARGRPVLEHPEGCERTRIFGRIGGIIAQVHESFPPVVRERGSEAEEAQVIRAFRRVPGGREDLLRSLQAVLERWRSGFAEMSGGPPARAVTIHGDFYPQQVLVSPCPNAAAPTLALLDWDETCVGDGERDVANFEAHLVLEQLRGRIAPEEADDLRNAFRRGYEELRRPRQGVLGWYLTGSLLRLAALYSRSDFGPYPSNPRWLAPELVKRAERSLSLIQA